MHTIKLNIEDSLYTHFIYLLKSLDKKELQIIEDKEIKNKSIIQEYPDETKMFSNHSANLIDDWKDSSEDKIWN